MEGRNLTTDPTPRHVPPLTFRTTTGRDCKTTKTKKSPMPKRPAPTSPLPKAPKKSRAEPGPPPLTKLEEDQVTIVPYSKKAKRAGEPVELRIATGQWLTVTKPKSRRGRHYAAHVRAVDGQFKQLGVPGTSANWRRMGFGRVAQLKRALKELAVEDAAAGGEESVVEATAPPTIAAAAVKVVIEM